jgi:hypothetical protein
MSSSPEEFREFADECLTWAKTARSDQDREVFLQMARTWIEATAAVEGKLGIVHEHQEVTKPTSIPTRSPTPTR